MNLFHDEEDGTPKEPVPGLPEALPEGETLLWQGRPSARGFALHVFHLRFVIAYFVVTAGFRVAGLAADEAGGAAIADAVLSATVTCLAALALLSGLGWLMARSTIYSITSRRIVLRHGVAIRKYVNVPFRQIDSASLKPHGKRLGDIALQMGQGGKPGFLHLWPHARPFRILRPEPMLRAIADPQKVGELLTGAIARAAPDGVQVKAPSAAAPKPRNNTAAKPATAGV